MASLQEMLGGIGWSLFVPAKVTQSQKQTQIDLEERAQRLNSNIPQTLAIATTSGVLSDGQAKATLQQMNQALFLANDAQRQLGEQIIDDVTSSAANAPSTLLNYTNDQILKPAGNAVKSTVQAVVPWQLWVIVGLALIVGVGIFAFGKSKT